MNSSSQPTTDCFQSFDHEYFNFLTWSNAESPKTVIIAVHGINGASADYDHLARHLLTNNKSIAVYAPETRGQGNDLNLKRRGDIYRKEEWFKDLHTFSKQIRDQHPDSEIIWCGESMGSIIVTHCLTHQRYFKPSRVILLAPVVSLRPHLSYWKHKLANLISYLLPRYRVRLNQFSGDDAVKVTQVGDDHEGQAATNPYYVEKFTLRLLSTLGNMISNMNTAIAKVDCPVIVLNGGLDYFTPSEEAEYFYSCLPSTETNKHAYFKDSYHLLMYDAHREQVFDEISKWINI